MRRLHLPAGYTAYSILGTPSVYTVGPFSASSLSPAVILGMSTFSRPPIELEGTMHVSHVHGGCSMVDKRCSKSDMVEIMPTEFRCRGHCESTSRRRRRRGERRAAMETRRPVKSVSCIRVPFDGTRCSLWYHTPDRTTPAITPPFLTASHDSGPLRSGAE